MAINTSRVHVCVCVRSPGTCMRSPAILAGYGMLTATALTAVRAPQLSAKPMEDFGEDWDQKGVTWQAFESSKPVLRGGLSSRCIVGETGVLETSTSTSTSTSSFVVVSCPVSCPLW